MYLNVFGKFEFFVAFLYQIALFYFYTYLVPAIDDDDS